MTKKELKDLLTQHKNYLDGKPNGKRLEIHDNTLSMSYLAGRSISLRDANLSHADLSNADLSQLDLFEANLSGADLHGTDLAGTNLVHSHMQDADLSGADLRVADLHGAGFTDACLSGVDIDGADLSCVYLNEQQWTCVFNHMSSDLVDMIGGMVNAPLRYNSKSIFNTIKMDPVTYADFDYEVDDDDATTKFCVNVIHGIARLYI